MATSDWEAFISMLTNAPHIVPEPPPELSYFERIAHDRNQYFLEMLDELGGPAATTAIAKASGMSRHQILRSVYALEAEGVIRIIETLSKTGTKKILVERV
jgi:hypothetical protein